MKNELIQAAYKGSAKQRVGRRRAGAMHMDGMDPTQFLFSGNQVYVAELYERYLDDPHSVDQRWQEFFAELADDATELSAEIRGASWAPSMRVS